MRLAHLYGVDANVAMSRSRTYRSIATLGLEPWASRTRSANPTTWLNDHRSKGALDRSDQKIVSAHQECIENWRAFWHDEVAEWLRRWTANPLGSARVGSNPILVEIFLLIFSLFFLCFVIFYNFNDLYEVDWIFMATISRLAVVKR